MKLGALPLALSLMIGTGFSAIGAAARADAHTYVIAIGNNRPPEGAQLPQLQYADDDAADFAMLAEELGADTALLTVLDHESQERFPGLARAARPPTLSELRRTVAAFRTRFEADRARGIDPVVLFFFSGHGMREPGQPAALAMLDGALTQSILYEEVLAALPARFVHLLVDACHAEAVVRPRDISADVVELSTEDVTALAAKNNLERFPHVGAIVAAESAAQAHEWEVYQRGIFTHETLSGLRGAADVNGDRRIEYSELSAFLTAANRDIANPRARPSIVVRVPALDRRAPLVDLARVEGSGRLVSGGAVARKFNVEDGLGNRLADVFSEPDHFIDLTLPANVTLYLRTDEREASFRLRAGEPLAIDDLALHKTPTRARGALETSLRLGLFGIPFGPVYYRGFVDSHPEFLSVPRASSSHVGGVAGARNEAAPSRWAPWLVTSLGIAAGVAAGVTLGFAIDARRDFEQTEFERPAAQAAERFATMRNASIGLAAAAAVTIGIGSWMLVRTRKARK